MVVRQHNVDIHQYSFFFNNRLLWGTLLQYSRPTIDISFTITMVQNTTQVATAYNQVIKSSGVDKNFFFLPSPVFASKLLLASSHCRH